MFTCKLDLFDFTSTVGFCSGAQSRWDEMTDEERNYLNECACDCEFDSLTQINDFVWFDSDDLLRDFRGEDED